MKAISQDFDWHGVDLDLLAWSGIIRSYRLADFMPLEKHSGEIQAKLLQMLDDLVKIRQQCPNLPWNATS